MEANSIHHHTDPLGKENIDRNCDSQKAKDKLAFAGIPASRTEASQFLRLAHAPVPLVTVGVQLSGGLFADSIFFDKAAIQRVAAPVLGKVAKMYVDLGVGAACTVLRVSETDAEIFVLGTNVLSSSDRERFVAEVDDCLLRAADEFRLVSELAAMPADDFSHAWFVGEIRPDQNFLPALRAILDLGRTLDNCKACRYASKTTQGCALKNTQGF